MIACERCGRLYPEVVGARTQVCPHCGLEVDATRTRGESAAPATDPLGAATLAARFVSQRYGALLLLALPVLAVALVASFVIQAYVVVNGLDAPVLTTGQQMQFLGVALPLMLLVGTSWFAYWLLPPVLLADGRVGGPRLRALARRWPQLLAAGFVLTLLYAVGALLFLVPFFVLAHWFLYVPAALAERETTIAGAFEASRRFARERRTHGFTALVLMVWAAVATLVLVADVVLSPRLGPLAAALWPVATWLLLPLVPALPAAFWSSPRAAAPAASPPASAPSRRARTTCPHCGAMIPYEAGPDGSPVDVRCPSCGKAGRVL